ncbi:hypothetical protein M404DRAFT_504898 [Pisolithus tinctorius Marx 270]|uniref:Uncharacterized protein n=1 Tax=Pisolithus tinctorius Marx 270 TaxID=870435 RepID=A0A0C3NYD0_PISTI|nr:hypothetical protein M404DRAFT_504898 [Pisolithus tinctorius Marx 270]
MMLSSLSLASFLPSILQPNTPPPTTSTIGLPDDKNGTMTPTADAPNPRKKSKKDRPPNETFIVVRPPPSKSIHPLNLQVQLVPPQSRVASSSSTVQALDSSHQNGTTDSSDLARTSSDRSDYSGYTSATSVSSFASTSTTSSGRRTIIPLYNLQAHHVMTNTIVDAGTDAKVAKFIKRGLEIVGLAILEPIEVWGSAPLPRTMPPEQTTTNIARTSIDDPQREFGAVSPRLSPRTYPASKDRPSTSYSTVSALDRDPYHRPPPAINVTLPPTDNSPLSAGDVPQSGPRRKKLFTSMFKKKDPSRTLSVAVPTSGTDPQAPPSAPPRITSHNVARGGPLPLRDPSHSGVPESAPYAQLGFGDGSLSPTPMTGTTPFTSTVYCSPVLGVQAALYPSVQPPPGRPTKYVWVIRKWLKGTETGLLNGMMGKLNINGRTGGSAGNMNAGMGPDGSGSVEVRFEWERGKKKQREKDRVRGKRQMGESHNETGQNNKQQTATVGRRPSKPLLSTPSPVGSIRRAAVDAAVGLEDQRLSIVSQHSNSDTVTDESSIAPHNARSQQQHRRSPGTDEDSGDDSDPEDSETPWICTLTIRRVWSHSSPSSSLRHPSVTAENHHSQPQSVCLKVATLSPTPHHPKVVGLLKVPFPLPDIEVEQMAVRKRIVTAHGVSRTTAETPATSGATGGSGYGGLVLTAEEIKDTISSTALWLVVREAFGGIGRDRKRGEGGGWRMRP